MIWLMEKKNYSITKQQYDDLIVFTELNQISDIEVFFQKCFNRGFLIEKYGLLGEEENIVEVIKEVEKPIEVIKYVDKIVKEIVYVETPVEVIKEVEKIVEIPFEKEVYVTDEEANGELIKKISELEAQIQTLNETKPTIGSDKERLLSQTIQTLRQEIFEKNKQIKELEDKIVTLKNENKQAIYLRGSNLNDML